MDFSPEREAGDRRTSKQRLRQLAYHQSPRIARAVAQNPNTPLTELIQLFYSYPDLVLRNPIFEENPAFLERFCQELNLNIFSLSQPRSSFIQNWALNNSNRYIRQCFAASSTINEFYLEKLAADRTVEVRLAVARNHKTPSNILEKLAKDPAEIVCAAVAQNLTTSEAILNDLAGHNNIKVRHAVALNPLISDAIKQELSKDETEVKIALLNNPSLTSELGDRIAESENEEIKIALAKMKNLSNNLLEKLVKDENISVKMALLKNPSIPRSILEKLAEDGAKEVRLFLAKQDILSPAIAAKLSRDSNPEVLLAIVNHPQISIDILKQLVANENESVCLAAAEKIAKRLSRKVSFEQKTIEGQDFIQYDDIIAAIDLEMKRLGWTKERRREYLMENYGKRSRHSLTDRELLEFLDYLRSLP